MVKQPDETMTIPNAIKTYTLITLGALIYAFGLEAFLIPNKVIDGGVVGISLILKQTTGFNFSIFLIVLNLPFLYLGYKQLGKSFVFQSLYGIILTAIFSQSLHDITPVTNEPFLASIFGGIILGVGVGIVLRNNGALDGTEILASLISKKSTFSVGQIVMFFNLFILSSAGFVFNMNSAFYSLI
jgi:uncharacterized membrane-anchored protein YitT (DUF2179 family)